MKTHKCLILLSILSAVVSVVLYGVTFFQSVSMLEFQYAQILLFLAEMFLVLTILFSIFLAISFKNVLSLPKFKKIIIGLVLACVAVCILVTGYGLLSCYNLYTPENIMENDKDYVQKFMPYHNILDDYKESTDLSVSHIPGTDYVYINCYGTSELGIPLNYEVEYFKSVSPFMNMKFRFERMVLSPLNRYDLDVVGVGEDMEIDGTKLTVYVENNDYAVLIKSFGKTIYASLINVPDEVTIEDFAKEVIRQFELIDDATQKKVFLDAPLF